jgi:hypothetical protein
MSLDRHRLWRVVQRNHAELETRAPEGYEAVVEIHIAGRADTLIVSRAETSRDPDYPWTLLHCLAEPDVEDLGPDDYFVFVLPDYIQSVELRFRKKGEKLAIGFSQGELKLPEPVSTVE